MRVILSRKGFDSANGGKPSPILPDGTLLSLPIPAADGRAYSELRYGGDTYESIIGQLGGKCGGGTCHLDPDIRQGVFNSPADWQPAYGQCGIPQMTLNKQGVGVGDLFLFFGWFKQTERGGDGKLRYARKAQDVHIVYGYLQIGNVITAQDEIAAYHWHPHASMGADGNCLYIPRDTLSWDSTKRGCGVFQYDERLVLTKAGMSKSCWNLPGFMNGMKISGSYKDAWRTDPKHGEYYRAMSIGQEFVIEDAAAVESWAQSLINGC
jgi:hypothetical protein